MGTIRRAISVSSQLMLNIMTTTPTTVTLETINCVTP